MRVTILAIGSRGDIQPYLALSKGLIEAGCTVRLATHAAFETLVHSYAIPFFPLDDDMQEVFQSERGRKALSEGMRLSFSLTLEEENTIIAVKMS